MSAPAAKMPEVTSGTCYSSFSRRSVRTMSMTA
jgi:hypothetical protein